MGEASEKPMVRVRSDADEFAATRITAFEHLRALLVAGAPQETFMEAHLALEAIPGKGLMFDVGKLPPVKFWGEPDPWIEVKLDFNEITPGGWVTTEVAPGRAPSAADIKFHVGSLEEVTFEFGQNADCIDYLTARGDRAPLLRYIKSGDLNTDRMRAFFTSLVLGEVSIPKGNPATHSKHSEHLRIARFVAIVIGYGGKPEQVYECASRKFGANKHHTYSPRQIKRIFDNHRDEAWKAVRAEKALFCRFGAAEVIRPLLLKMNQITEEDIAAMSKKRPRRTR